MLQLPATLVVLQPPCLPELHDVVLGTRSQRGGAPVRPSNYEIRNLRDGSDGVVRGRHKPAAATPTVALFPPSPLLSARLPVRHEGSAAPDGPDARLRRVWFGSEARGREGGGTDSRYHGCGGDGVSRETAATSISSRGGHGPTEM